MTDIHQQTKWNVGDRLDLNKLPLKLDFDSEFATAGIDPNKFRPTYPWGNSKVINDERQGYPETFGALPSGFRPVSVDPQGILQLSCAPTDARDLDHVNNMPYTSGLITTQGLYSFFQGAVSVRARFPKRELAFPCALWALPDFPIGPWPESLQNKKLPEWDIVENIGHTTRVLYFTAHTNDPSVDGGKVQKQIIVEPGQLPDYGDDFHTYTGIWTDDFLYWLIDGVVVFKAITPADFNTGEYVHRMLLANLAFDSGWSRVQPQYDQKYKPFQNQNFPIQLSIEYIRAYTWKAEEAFIPEEPVEGDLLAIGRSLDRIEAKIDTLCEPDPSPSDKPIELEQVASWNSEGFPPSTNFEIDSIDRVWAATQKALFRLDEEGWTEIVRFDRLLYKPKLKFQGNSGYVYGARPDGQSVVFRFES